MSPAANQLVANRLVPNAVQPIDGDKPATSAQVARLDESLFPERIRPYNPLYGAIAQLAERLVCNQKVAGSIPAGSTEGSRLRSGLV